MSRLGPFNRLAVFGFDNCLTISRLIAGFRWLVEAEGCRIYNFKLYPALHKLGSRLLIRFCTVLRSCLCSLAYRRFVAGICATLPPVTGTEVVSVDRPPEGGICWF